MQSAFPAYSAFFVTSKRWSRIKLIVSIRPDHTGANLRSDFENFGTFICPDSSAQTIRNVVGLFNNFFNSSECLNCQYRSEDFFWNYAWRLSYIRKNNVGR